MRLLLTVSKKKFLICCDITQKSLTLLFTALQPIHENYPAFFHGFCEKNLKNE